MCQQLELPFMDQTPYTPYYSIWRELFKHDNQLAYTTPDMATKFLMRADVHEDAIAEFLSDNTAICSKCRGKGRFDPRVCHGFGYSAPHYLPCIACHCTGTVFINVPNHV
jgi:hypothetical protein